MKIGDKIEQGFRLLESGKWEGAYIFLEGVANLYMLDAIEDIIYEKLSQYVSVMDVSRADTESSQWLKLLLLDARYGQFMLKPGDIVENLKEFLNTFPEIPDSGIVQSFIEGEIGKVKYLDGAFYTVQKDFPNLSTLVRISSAGVEPVDFDVEDFDINRQTGRIEFHYSRGLKGLVSINPDGSDKLVDGKVYTED